MAANFAFFKKKFLFNLPNHQLSLKRFLIFILSVPYSFAQLLSLISTPSIHHFLRKSFQFLFSELIPQAFFFAILAPVNPQLREN